MLLSDFTNKKKHIFTNIYSLNTEFFTLLSLFRTGLLLGEPFSLFTYPVKRLGVKFIALSSQFATKSPPRRKISFSKF